MRQKFVPVRRLQYFRGLRIQRFLAVDAGMQIIAGRPVRLRDRYLAVVVFCASAPTAHPANSSGPKIASRQFVCGIDGLFRTPIFARRSERLAPPGDRQL